jgi:hypothetical protein
MEIEPSQEGHINSQVKFVIFYCVISYYDEFEGSLLRKSRRGGKSRFQRRQRQLIQSTSALPIVFVVVTTVREMGIYIPTGKLLGFVDPWKLGNLNYDECQPLTSSEKGCVSRP